MWIADNWKDYEDDKKWFKPNGHYHRSNKGGGQWQFLICLNSGPLITRI